MLNYHSLFTNLLLAVGFVYPTRHIRGKLRHKYQCHIIFDRGMPHVKSLQTEQITHAFEQLAPRINQGKNRASGSDTQH